MCLSISLCVVFFAFEFSKQEGYKAPQTILAVVFAQLGFWVGLLTLVGLAAVLVKLFQPEEKVSALFAGCLIIGVFVAWVLTMITAMVGIVWEMRAWWLS